MAWFSVVDCGGIVVRAHVCSPPNDKPAILQRMMELLNSGQSHSLLTLTQEFPGDSRIIEAIDDLLRHYRVRKVDGIHWSSDNGHSIHIKCE